MKMNEARVKNNKAVVEENERINDPTYEKRKIREAFVKDKKHMQKELED